MGEGWSVTHDLLHPLLVRATDLVPGAIGAGIGIYGGAGGHLVAGAGCAEQLDSLQWDVGEGPVPRAATADEVVLSDDLRTDERWPALRQALRTSAADWPKTLAMVARPGPWNQHGVTVFSFYLSSPPQSDVLTEIARHEAPAAVALALIEGRDAQRVDQMSELVRSRGVIDQAKGVIMGHIRCTPEEAFEVLRLASQQHNIKVRDLAASFVRHVMTAGGVGGADHGTQDADRVAQLVWESVTSKT